MKECGNVFSDISLDSQTVFFFAALLIIAMIFLSIYYLFKFGSRKVFLIMSAANFLQLIYYATLFNISVMQLKPPRFFVNSIEVISMTMYIVAIILTVSKKYQK